MQQKNKKDKPVTISADTYRRLLLLAIVASFGQGCFGAKRLQKLVSVTERETGKERTFTYRRWHHGQYSEQLETLKDQLLSMRLLIAAPLTNADAGNRYAIHSQAAGMYFLDVLRRVNPQAHSAMLRSVAEYGYLSEAELVRRCYEFPEFQATAMGDVIWEANLPERVPVSLDEDEADSLELSLNPALLESLLSITDSLNHTSLDWNKVESVELAV